MNVFVAGASGAIGRPIIAELLRHGHNVTGMARSQSALADLRTQGATVVEADVFDFDSIRAALKVARPDVVIDELTSLPKSSADLAKAIHGDCMVRLEGGGNLHRAAEELSVKRYLQQSSGFFLQTDGGLADEASPLAVDAGGNVGLSSRMYAELERRVLNSSMEGIALRYGFFYGPGTWYRQDGTAAEQVRRNETPIVGDGNAVWSFVHVEDAAVATVAALTAEPGVYNITDDDPCPVSQWLPAFAEWIGAPAPPHRTVEQAREAAGEEAVFYGTKLVGASNAKARKLLGFRPRRLAWL
jgi:nucleoside-diphosphate-sugar epimerase